MIKTTLYYYNLALRDVKLNSIPSRNVDGSYKFSNGQEEILNDSQYDELRKHNTEIVQLEAKKDTLKREMQVYKNPAHSLEQEGDALAKVRQSEINDEQLNLKDFKAELKQFDEDMFTRGYCIEDDKPAETKPKETKTKKRNGGWKRFLSFIGMWILLEIFMTLIQFSSLQNDRSIIEILVRSFSLAMMLLFFHLILDKNKEDKRGIYIGFLIFNLIIIAIMMFLPPLLFHIYPVNSGSTTSAWSLTEETAKTVTEHSDIPSLVLFYRNNEWIPPLLCSLFFMVVYFGLKKSEEPKESPVQKTEPEMKPKTVQDEIREKRNHLIARIRECENHIEDLQNRLTSALTPNTTHIANVLTKLETAKTEIIAADNKITELKTKIEALLKAVEKELNTYQVEFLDILRNDHIKSSFVTPEWNNRNDIIHYFKIQTK